MANPNDDPALQQFLASQAKPVATTDELAKLGSHTRSNPLKKRGPDRAIFAIVGFVVVSIFVRFLVREMRNVDQREAQSKPFRVELTQEQARELLKKLDEANSTPPEAADAPPTETP